MVSKTRTSINIPTDLLTVIHSLRKNRPDLSQQDALILLARKGAMSFEMANISELCDAVQRLENHVKNVSDRLFEEKFSEACSIKTFAILRRYIYESDPDLLKICDSTSEQLLHKIKE